MDVYGLGCGKIKASLAKRGIDAKVVAAPPGSDTRDPTTTLDARVVVNGGATIRAVVSVVPVMEPSCHATLNGVAVNGVVWADTNMDVSKFRDGKRIPEVRGDEAWRQAMRGQFTAAWCHYENDKANCANGKLYFAPTIDELAKMCPVGWRIPTYAEWRALMTFYGADFDGADRDDPDKARAVWAKLRDGPLRGVLAGSRDRNGTFLGECMVWAVRDANYGDGQTIRTVGLRIDGKDIVFWNATTSDAFSVRLVRETH